MNQLLLTSSLLCLTTGACAPTWTHADAVRGRASADFGCPQEDIRVEHTGRDDRYFSNGCGKRAEYACREESHYQTRYLVGLGVEHDLECRQIAASDAR